MIISEYTPALVLAATSEISKELNQFEGMNTAVVAIVVMYLIVKLILDHSSKSVKNRNIEDLIKSQNQTRDCLERLSLDIQNLSTNILKNNPKGF